MADLDKQDIFCSVVDNFGDIDVCWRLACNLAARGKVVRLWVDDVSPLAWMAPNGCADVEVIDCKNGLPNDKNYALGDVLVDTFDCEFAINLIATQTINKPASGINSTISEQIRPVWLNLEYLTAESFAERAHTLPYVHHSAATQGWKLNFVRGEDSLVRAIWAAKPFIWQIYPQHVGMHLAKLDTFLTMMDAPESLKIVHQLSNSSANEAISPDLELGIWTKSAQNLSKKLRLQVNLASSLIAFVEKNSYNNGLTSKSYRKAIKILPKY